MPVPVVVDDPADTRLAPFRDLTDAEVRRTSDAFIAEGVFAIRELFRSRFPVRSVLATPAKWARLAGDVGGSGVDHSDVEVFLADQAVLNEVAGFNFHRGALAAGVRTPLPPVHEAVGGATRVAVVEQLNDPENLGSIFRNAAAFGVGAVLLCPQSCDPLYRRVVRVSMGHVLHVPFTRAAPWPDSLAGLRADGFVVAALTPDPSAQPIDAVAADVPRIAWLLGAEGPGLSPDALAAADLRVRIPIAAGVDSLNVATAAAIAFFHTRPPELP